MGLNRLLALPETMREIDSNQPSVGIVLLTYNQLDYTKDCIQSIMENTYYNYRVIVVDNFSKDGTDVYFNHLADNKIKYIRNDENWGFATGNNIGIRFCFNNHFDYVLVMNNDVLVDRDFLTTLVNSANNQNGDFVMSGKILYQHDKSRIWYAGGYFSYLWGIGKQAGMGKEDVPKFNDKKKVQCITGCMMFAPTRVFQKYGLFREEFFIYMEDTELNLKYLRNNVDIVYEPHSVIYHRVGAGKKVLAYTPFYLYHITRNRIFIAQNIFYRLYLFFLNCGITACRLVLYSFWGENGKSQIQAILLGFRDIFRIKQSNFYHYPFLKT